MKISILSLILLAASALNARMFVSTDLSYPPDGGAYVVEIKNESDINHARSLIRFVSSGRYLTEVHELRTVSAKIISGSDGINRDYSKPGAPAWSWSILEFNGFADFVAEVQDGWPDYVESDVAGWIANTANHAVDPLVGYIGFGFYTITGELPLQFNPIPHSEWQYCPWYGWFYDQAYPWVYHQAMGWSYIKGFDPENIWMFSQGRGSWLWTSESLFPNVWDGAAGSWCYYVEFNHVGWLYDSKSGAWKLY